MIRLAPWALVLALSATEAIAATGALLHQPDISGERVVFVHAGDLWWAPVSGGPAVRLTIDDGEESMPRFSPDGARIAFTGELDGNRDVYVMNRDGSEVRRLTFHPEGDDVVGWNPEGTKVWFRSTRHAWPSSPRVMAIGVDGAGLEELPLPEAAWVASSPDGRYLVYNREERERRTWKRYQGGLAQDLELYDTVSGENRKLTQWKGTDRLPLWVAGRIVYLSDRDGNLDLWSLDPMVGGEPTQLTHHDQYDAHFPADDGLGRIVYETAGDLRVFDLESGDDHPIEIELAVDAAEARPYIADVSGDARRVGISPTGKRALVVARGEVFSVPGEHGAIRNLSRADGAHDEFPVWSPDGERVAFLSDRDGEWQIWLVDAAGGEPRKLTSFGPGYRHTLRWSPDGTKIAVADQTLTVSVVEVGSGAATAVDKADFEPMDIALELKPIHDFAWSPDSRFLAYSKIGPDMLSQVWIHDLGRQRSIRVSDGRFNDSGPVFAADGQHLLFVSSRHFEPTFDDYEWEMVFTKTTGIYSAALAVDAPALLPPRSDEEGASKAATAGTTPRTEVDEAGLAERLEALPLPAGNYRELAASASRIFALDGEGDFNRVELRAPEPRRLVAFDLEERELITVVEGVEEYHLAAKGEQLVVRTPKGVAIVPASAKETKPELLDLAQLRMTIDPRQEWSQLYWEAWRLERDFFYDPRMHGLDWRAIGERYGRLLPAAASRRDVGWLIGEMIGELNTSHTYVFGGDVRREAQRVRVGMLGADFAADSAAGRWRIARILDTADYASDTHPPLARPGVEVAAGDYLLAVDGVEVTTEREPWAWFQDLAERQVTIEVASRPNGSRRQLRVETIASERALRYQDWVERNRQRVSELSGGRVGYIHLPDTYLGAAREFSRQFLSQTRLPGLVIDGRGNGGGLDPDIFLQRLAKRTLAWWTRRHSTDYTSPLVSTRAHMAMVTNRRAGSGGDMLPFQFRQLGLGPVVGTRTWGGLVGVSTFIRLMDGGGLTAPDYRIYDESGSWVVENTGVVPDVEVEIMPGEDGDAQLEAATRLVLEAIEKDPRPSPTRPTPPTGI